MKSIKTNRLLTVLALIFAFQLATADHSQAVEILPHNGTVSITLDPAYSSIPGIDAFVTALETDIENELGIALANLKIEADEELKNFKQQEDLARGFADANSFAGNAATLQGHQNYDLFAVSTGFMLGVQAPSLDPAYYENIDQEIKDKGDINAGLGVGVTWVNLGLYMGRFFDSMEDIYINVKFGGFSYDIDMGDSGDANFKTQNFGIGLNYRLLRSRGLGWGFLRWRGISLGSGFYYNHSEVSFTPKLDSVSSDVSNITGDFDGAGPVPAYSVSGTLIADPSVNLAIDTTTWTIPLEATTSVQLLWLFNLNLGVGVDFIFGKSSIILASDAAASGDLTEESDLFDVNVQGYSLEIDGSTKNIKPSFVRPRVMAGIGFNLWMVKVDVPVIWYPQSGFAAGLTFGIVW